MQSTTFNSMNKKALEIVVSGLFAAGAVQAADRSYDLDLSADPQNYGYRLPAQSGDFFGTLSAAGTRENGVLVNPNSSIDTDVTLATQTNEDSTVSRGAFLGTDNHRPC